MSYLTQRSQSTTTAPRRRTSLPRFGFAGWLAIMVLTFWISVAFFGPLLSPHTVSEIVASKAFAMPGIDGILGSDYLNRDVAARLIYGARVTLGLAFSTCAIAFVMGTTLGFTAAVLGGRVDDALSRINDAFLAFPSIIFALIVISALGTSLVVLVLTVGFIEATRVFRVSRALGIEISVMDFVEVARARGEGTWWILFNEILPNTVLPLSTDFGIRFIFVILTLSAISFLGLGVQPPYADWGGMVRENLTGIHFLSLATFLPAFCIFSVTLSINLLIDWALSRSDRDIPNELLT